MSALARMDKPCAPVLLAGVEGYGTPLPCLPKMENSSMSPSLHMAVSLKLHHNLCGVEQEEENHGL